MRLNSFDCCGGVPNIEFILIFSKKKKLDHEKVLKKKIVDPQIQKRNHVQFKF